MRERLLIPSLYLEADRVISTPTAPLLEAVEYYDYQFEAELSAQNVYKGHPRPELDAAWERVGRSEYMNE